MRSYSGLFHDTIVLCKLNFTRLLKISLILLIPQAVLTYAQSRVSFGWLDMYFGISFGIVFLLLTFFVTMSILYTLHSFLQNKAMAQSEVFITAARAFLSVLGLNFVLYIGLAFVVPLVGVWVLRELLFFTPLAAGLGRFLFLPLIALSGIAFSLSMLVRYGFAIFFLLFERVSVAQAMGKSKALVAGNFWHIALRQVVVGFVLIVGMVILGIVATMLVGAVSGNWLDGIMQDTWWGAVILNAFGTLILPLIIGLNLIIYSDLIGWKVRVRRKEM
ncbi:MAG: hypothetical protein UW24_C0005G0032 [Parcubacteria group bacterium GW2011_GWA2_44_12]|nr:MAG: hypothetical protein UW24_C0005G0032 [Parcubacteria group bacterium GW2011_GWA2_44_12]